MRLPLAVAAALCLVAGSPASAGPGAPDPRFGDGGWVRMTFGPADDANAIVRRADGRIVVGGGVYGLRDARGAERSGFLLSRYLPNGRLDTSFGDRGVARTMFGLHSSVGDLVELPGGRLLAAGATHFNASGPKHGVALARYLPNGRPDRTFGNGGRVVVPVANGEVNGATLAIARDGRIVVAGSYNPTQTSTAPYLRRFHPDGRPDVTFGDRGTVLPAFGGGNGSAGPVIPMPDGSIVVSGRFGASAFLVRYQPDGTLDPSWGTTRFEEAFTDIGGAVRLRDGRFLLAGKRWMPNANTAREAAVVARFGADGRIDRTFGAGGFALASAGVRADAGALSVAELPDGRIVAMCQTVTDGDSDVMLARFTKDGLPDTSFGERGVAVSGTRGRSEATWSMLVEPDGSITAAGISWPVNTPSGMHTLLARFSS